MVDVRQLRLTAHGIASSVVGDLMGPDRPVSNVQIDSRECGNSSLFVPLKGERTDGHLFIEAAVQAGSSLSFVSRRYYAEHQPLFAGLAENFDVSFLVVDDPLSALQALAADHLRQMKNLSVIGITGSYGKTTTKEMLGAMLSEHTSAAVSPGNLNSEIGLPLSALRIRETDRCALFEMAVNNRGEMDVLVDIARPQYAAITNIGMAHIGLLGSKDRIAEEKRKIFNHVEADGWGFIAEDEPYRDYLAQACRGSVEYFGVNTTPGFEEARDLGLDGTKLIWGGRAVRLPVIGKHNVKNVLCAISVALKLGISDDAIVRGLEKVEPLFGRGEVLRGAVTVVRDCYNANTDSSLRIIDFIGTLPWTGRKILVLGSMKELGSESESEHRAIGRYAAASSVNALFFYGDEAAAAFHEAVLARKGAPQEKASGASMGSQAGNQAGNQAGARGRPEGEKLIRWTSDFDELNEKLQSYIQPGDLVLLKGSRSVQLERLTEGIVGTGP